MSQERFFEQDRRWMQVALREAQRAFDAGEVPVGAVVVCQNELVGKAHNQVEQLRDPTAHAEILAITAACHAIGEKYLNECTLYVTLEPCPMCAGATVLARLKRLVFAAFDEKMGAASTLYNIPQDARLNHQVEIVSGIEEDTSVALLRAFFQTKRSRKP